MEPGELIDHYRLVSLVGAGGMGEVYRAVDERLRRDVAIKVLPHSGSSADRDARLLREAQAASHLNHPGIVIIHDVGRWHDRTYIVMELVDGRRLSELAAVGISSAQAVTLCRQAAEAMAVAHERGILHRDIKPDNLMMTRDERVKILDFGVAKVYDPEASIDTPLPGPLPAIREPPQVDPSDALDDTLVGSPHTPSTISVTRTGALLGTPAYMSPEQAAGAPVDERSEVYSLGLVLYELLTGVRPLQRATLMDTLAAARAPAIRPPSQAARGREVLRGCDRLLARALAPAPADRHPTMRALAGELLLLERSFTARRRRRWPIVVAAACLAGAGGAAFALWPGAGSSRAAGAVEIDVTSVRRLTFDPGCEELPSFWPDGNAVVYDAVVDGDTEIVRLDLASGARQRLTHRPGWDIGATVSPDGRSVAFLAFTDRGRELMVMPWSEQGAGEPRPQGLFRGYPSWTDDGSLLFGDGQSGIVRMDPARGTRQVVASAPGYVAISAEEMAGGEVLLALRHVGQNAARMVLGRVRGGRVELLGGGFPTDEVVIARDAAGRGFYVGMTSDTGPRLVWRSLDGRESRELASLPFPHGGVSADRSGRRLVMSTCGQVFRVGRIESGRFEPVFDGRDWNDNDLVAVGDGSYVFTTNRSGSSEIWSGRPGQPPRRLIAQPSGSPAVSRDGQLLAWVSDSGSLGIHLSRRSDGSHIRRLTTDETDDRPGFSRDGAFVYFIRGGRDGARVFRVLAAGGDPAPVSDRGAIGFDVSPDDRLAVVIQDEHGRHVVVGAPNGPFTRVPTLPDGNYTEVAYSGDGATLWVARGGSEILELPADGRGEPRVIWQTTNDLVSSIRADGDGLIADVATYDGDLYLVEGRFR